MIEAPTRRTFALASCAALAALVWLLGTWFEGPAGVGGIAPGEVRGRAEAPPDAGTSAQDRQDDNDRAATAHAAAAPQRQRERSPVLHVRLRGLHASAPWTASLELEIDALDAELQLVHHEDKQVPDAEGRVAFALPASLDGLVTNGGIDADDANYLPLHRGWKEVLDLTREVEIDVQVVAVLQGRVVDGRSAPVPAARIVAFEQRDGQPLDRKLGECNTDAGGAYSLRVPPNIELFLVASPMQRRGSLDRTTNDTGELRSDLLPATQRAAGVLGSATTLADFVLRDATPVTGVVRWSNGTPVQLATVRCEPRRGAHLTISPGASLCIDANGDLCPGSRTDTDEQGRFALAAVPGAALDVIVDCVPTVLVVGDALRREAVPSVPVEMVIPAPITLRCVRAGSPLPEAEIAIEGWREHTTAANGELRFVLTQESVRVRATHE
ncbi:MAG TPA: hypothetical protein VFZ65_22050, partial [Planctomycetota bacterium]|nr:hypothetical protein [Planctomycetota bacterium]